VGEQAERGEARVQGNRLWNGASGRPGTWSLSLTDV